MMPADHTDPLPDPPHPQQAGTRRRLDPIRRALATFAVLTRISEQDPNDQWRAGYAAAMRDATDALELYLLTDRGNQ